MKNDVLEYFKAISGKRKNAEVVAKKLKNLNPQLGSEFAEILGGDDFNQAGANKTCTFFGDKKVFACLKSKETAKKALDQFNVENGAEIVAYNDELISKGAQIAKVYTIFYADKKYVEIQHRVQGEPVAINAQRKFEQLAGDKIAGLDKEKDAEKIREIYGDTIFEFNYKQQELLKKLPQEAYDKLFKTFLIFRDCKTKFYDNHCENILVGENGFTLIDLNYKKMLEDRDSDKPQPSITEVIVDYVVPFSLSSMFRRHLSPEQAQKLDNNNIQIAAKMLQSIKNNNVKFEMNNLIETEFYYMLGPKYKSILNRITPKGTEEPQITR